MVDVLLSTYNGEKYLGTFLRSLAAQSCSDFRVLARDDGSGDGSAALLREFAAEKKLNISFTPDSGEHLGVVPSFASLLRESTAPYVMFADQDDIWHPGKIDAMLKHIQLAEAERPPQTPLLLHADLRICDEKGRIIGSSHVKSQRLSPDRNSLEQLCVQNCVTGCAMILNRPLKELVRYPMPQDTLCHDWYLAMLGAAAGEVVFVSQTFTDYRKHSSNVYGHRKYSFALWFKLFFSGRKALDQRLQLAQKQSLAFLEQYGDILSEEQKEHLHLWGNIKRFPKLERLKLCRKRKYRKNTFLRTLGMWWSI